MKIRRINIKSMLETAATAEELEGRALMEIARERIQKRIGYGEHIHLYADDAEECLYPQEQCWQGLRDMRSSRVYGF